MAKKFWKHKIIEWILNDLILQMTRHPIIKQQSYKDRKGEEKKGIAILSDNQEKLGVYPGYVRLLAQKTNLETQVVRGVCLGMSKTF